MQKRDLFRLPLGEYKLTDGIYNYTMLKSVTKDTGLCIELEMIYHGQRAVYLNRLTLIRKNH